MIMWDTATVIAIGLAIWAFYLLLKPESLQRNLKEMKELNRLFKSSKHHWEKSDLKSWYFCYLCHQLITGWWTDVQECNKCGVVIHKLCKYFKLKKPDCKYMVLIEKTKEVSHSDPQNKKSSRNEVAGKNSAIFHHQWRQCSHTASSKCASCQTACVGFESYICLWCQRVKHGQCSVITPCDFGPLREFIIEPSEITISSQFFSQRSLTLRKKMQDSKISRTSDEESPSEEVSVPRLHLSSVSKRPVIVLVNKRSGGCVGPRIIKQFYQALNPLQVISIVDEGLDKLSLFEDLPNLFFVIAGGDGTVCSVLNYIKSMPKWRNKNPPAAILPLGTGNDLSRSLGWGGGVDQFNVEETLMNYSKGLSRELDRWTMTLERQDFSSQFTIYNYFGIGLDAKICKDFHDIRQKYPQLFFSQFSNKIIYTQMGTMDLFKGSATPLEGLLTVRCNGQSIDLKDLQGIIFLNILHWGGGVTKLWKPDGKFKPQSYNDGMIELIGMSDVLHIGQVQISIDEPYQLAQGHTFEIICTRPGVTLPLQIDGEPLQAISPFKMTIQFKDKVNLLISRSSPSSRIHKIVERALDDKVIDESQATKLLEIAQNVDYVSKGA